MRQNKFHLIVLVLLIFSIIAVAWQVTTSRQPRVEMPTSEPLQQAPKAQEKPPVAQPTQPTSPEQVATLQQTTTATQQTKVNQSSTPAQVVVEKKNDVIADAIVIISDFEFTPKQANIRVGQTVRWEYPSGSNKHAIGFRKSGPRSSLLMQGDSWQHTFNESGVYEYVDLVFTFIEGKVVVGELNP